MDVRLKLSHTGVGLFYALFVWVLSYTVMSIGLGFTLSPNNAALYSTVVAWIAAVPLTWEYVKNHEEPVDEAFKLGVWFAAVSLVFDLVLLTTAAEYTWAGFILNAGYKYPVLMLVAVATAEAQKQLQ